jgi:hypothetical protein
VRACFVRAAKRAHTYGYSHHEKRVLCNQNIILGAADSKSIEIYNIMLTMKSSRGHSFEGGFLLLTTKQRIFAFMAKKRADILLSPKKN